MLGCLASMTCIAWCPLELSPYVTSAIEYVVGPGFVRSLALIPLPWMLRFLCCRPQQLVEGLALIVLFSSIQANLYLAPAHSTLFLNQEKDLIKVTGGLALQRQVCCMWQKRKKTNKKLPWFQHFSLVSESFSLIILGEMLIVCDWFVFLGFFVCLFLKRKKKICFISGTMYCRCPVRIQYERNAYWMQSANREGRRKGTKCYL